MTIYLPETRTTVWKGLDERVNSIEQESSIYEIELEDGYRTILEDSPTLTNWSDITP